jgi:hypothetical protein
MTRWTRLAVIAAVTAALGLSACGRRPDTLQPPGTPADGEAAEAEAPAPSFPRTYPTY